MTIETQLNDNDIIMMNEISANVERGAKFLDRLDFDIPWHQQINIEDINMASGDVCIAGQLFMRNLEDSLHLYDHGFHYMLEEYYDGDSFAAADDGFNLPADVLKFMDADEEQLPRYDWIANLSYFAVYRSDRIYEFLAEEWITQIEKRKAEAGEML
jgi:hypothetical protein